MQAIKTKYLPPTNHRGSRIVAECQAATKTTSYDYALNIEDNHRKAAEALAGFYGWTKDNRLCSGVIKSGEHVHVLVRK